MAKLLDEHECESCNNQTYHVRLAETQPVRIANEKAERTEYAYADYAVIRLINVTDPESGSQYHEVSVIPSDKEENIFPGYIYMYNRARSLDEVLWTIGGEWRPKEEVSSGTP